MNKYFFGLLIVVFLILLIGLTPDDYIKTFDFKYADKIKHILAFFVLSFFLYKSFEEIKGIYKFYSLVIFACAIEIIQSFVGREANILDFMASCFGIIIYIVFCVKKKGYR